MSQISLNIEAKIGQHCTTLLTVGQLPDDVNSQAPFATEQEITSYRVRHEAMFALYSMRMLEIKDAHGSGDLIIHVCIPRDSQLAGRKSPLSILKVCHDLFAAMCMSRNADGKYELKDVDEQAERIISNALSQYSLVPRKTRYVVMSGSGIGFVKVSSEVQVEELFVDSHYEEFRNFQSIELSSQKESTVSIDIPRRVSYQVFVNGEKTGISLSASTERYSTEFKDSEYVKYNNVSFSLGELLDSSTGLFDGRVTIDAMRESIMCKVGPNFVKIAYKVRIVGGDADDRNIVKIWLKKGDARILTQSNSGEERDVTSNFLSGEDITLSGESNNVDMKVCPEAIGIYRFAVIKDAIDKSISLRVERIQEEAVAISVDEDSQEKQNERVKPPFLPKPQKIYSIILIGVLCCMFAFLCGNSLGYDRGYNIAGGLNAEEMTERIKILQDSLCLATTEIANLEEKIKANSGSIERYRELREEKNKELEKIKHDIGLTICQILKGKQWAVYQITDMPILSHLSDEDRNAVEYICEEVRNNRRWANSVVDSVKSLSGLRNAVKQRKENNNTPTIKLKK